MKRSIEKVGQSENFSIVTLKVDLIDSQTTAASLREFQSKTRIVEYCLDRIFEGYVSGGEEYAY